MSNFRTFFRASFFLAAALSSTFGFSQSFKLGAGGAVHAYSTHFGEPEQKEEFDSKLGLGYSPGLFTNIMFDNDFSLQTEFYYSWQGRKMETNEPVWKHHAKYQFIEVPILLRKSFHVKVYRDIPTTWFVNVGPNLKYWTKGKGHVITSDNVEIDYKVLFEGRPEEDFPTENMYLTDVNRFLFGLTAGVGFSIDVIKLNTVFFELRYTHGQTFYGGKESHAYNILGFRDSLKGNSRIVSFTACYMLEFNYFQIQQKTNLKKHRKNPKPKKRG